MPNNDVKIDHEAAKKWAEDECRSPLFPGQDTHNLAAAYLDLLAQRDEALALLEKLLYYTIANESEVWGVG